MQKARDAALAGGAQNVPGADEIDRLKFRAIPFPHAGQAGQMVDLIDISRGTTYQIGVEHRSFDILHCW
jgi:hypothetical protein